MAIVRYAQLRDTLRGLLNPGDDVERRARSCLDNATAAYALEKLGAEPAGAARRLLEGSAIPPGYIDWAIDHIDLLFDGQNIRDMACALLDSSAAGPGSRDAGVFYTPMPVARFICKHAIGSFLLSRVYAGTGKRFDSPDEALGHNGVRPAYTAALAKIRLFDSSCGSGIFLQAALDELYGLKLKAFGHAGETVPREEELKRGIIETSLFGMDIDPYSIEIAGLRLRILSAGANDPGPVKANLTCANALFARPPETGPFDVIVGNPPYMRVKNMFSGGPKPEGLKRKTDLAASVRDSRLYRFQEGNLNLYKLFLERNLAFLRDGGSMGLIIPSSFLNEATSQKLRKHVFDACRMEEIIEIPERSRIFGSVNQATAILIINNSPPRGGCMKLRTGIGTGDLDAGDGSISIGYDELAHFTDGRMEVPLLRRPSLEWGMLKRMRGIPAFTGGNGAPAVGKISVGHVDETFDKTYISTASTGDIFVKGIHLKEYSVDLSPEGGQPRWVRKEEFLCARPSALPVISQWRIIGRNTQNKACARRLKFALLPPGYLCSNSIKQIVVEDEQIEPLYLLGLLNSSTLNWYFELFCSQNNIRNYRIEALPIVRAPKDVQDIFARVVRLIMGSTGDTRVFLDRMLMDTMAYELYFLDDRELIEEVKSLQKLDDADLIGRAGSAPEIRRRIVCIMADERYGLIREAAFKEQKAW